MASQPPAGWLEGLNEKLGYVSAQKLLVAAKREAREKNYQTPTLEDVLKITRSSSTHPGAGPLGGGGNHGGNRRAIEATGEQR